MIMRPPRSTRTDTSFPTRRSSDLPARGFVDIGEHRPGAVGDQAPHDRLADARRATRHQRDAISKGLGHGASFGQGCMKRPPSAWKVMPVRKLASSLARKTAKIGRASSRARECQYV